MKRSPKRNPALHADPFRQALVDNFSKVQQSRMFKDVVLSAHKGWDKSKIADKLREVYGLNGRFAAWLVGHAVQKPLSNPARKFIIAGEKKTKKSKDERTMLYVVDHPDGRLAVAIEDSKVKNYKYRIIGGPYHSIYEAIDAKPHLLNNPKIKSASWESYKRSVKKPSAHSAHWGSYKRELSSKEEPCPVKTPPVPKILQSVPLHLGDMTDAQWDASVLWYSKLPLKELRKRQDITIGQREDLYRRTRARHMEMSAHELMGWNNLQIMEDILTQAVMRKMPRYRKNPATTVTKDQLTELYNLYHLAQTALSGKENSKWHRMIWAAKEFHKLHPSVSENSAYINLSNDIGSFMR